MNVGPRGRSTNPLYRSPSQFSNKSQVREGIGMRRICSDLCVFFLAMIGVCFFSIFGIHVHTEYTENAHVCRLCVGARAYIPVGNVRRLRTAHIGRRRARDRVRLKGLIYLLNSFATMGGISSCLSINGSWESAIKISQ